MNRNRMFLMTAVLSIGMAIWLPGLRSRRVAAQILALMGSYGYQITVPDFGALQGVITLDGAGNATGGGGVNVGVDADPNATVPQVKPANSSQGTYTVNPDGTGTITLQNPNGKITSLAFVITDGGSQLMVVATAGVGNVVAAGIARKQ